MGIPQRKASLRPPGGAGIRGPSGVLSQEQFRRISRLLHQLCGIHIQTGKEQLVRARLWKRMQALGLRGFDDYVAMVESGAGERERMFMIDALTTNETSFFREPQHFSFLREEVRERMRSQSRLRVWSAGCSSGQEPYSIAIVLLEELPDAGKRDVRILATDICAESLRRGKAAAYQEHELDEVPPAVLRRHFSAQELDGRWIYRVGPAARDLVRFARLNLMGPWPMRGPFDFIFCRNVMMYFDRTTQQELVGRFRAILASGGYLFVGHSEGLTSKVEGLTYVTPAVYRR